MEKKTLQERWDEEMLTDNSQFNLCEQCKECIFQSDGTVWSNNYDKTCCQKYPYPAFKPNKVMQNLINCQYRMTK